MKIPKLENIVPAKGYSFTVNPAEQYFGDVERFRKVIYLMKSKLSSPRFEYKLYIEASPKGRVHGHGYIWIHDPFGFVLFDVPFMERFMNIDIDDINDEDVWYNYCTKQLHITRTQINRMLPKQSDKTIKTAIDDYYNI